MTSLSRRFRRRRMQRFVRECHITAATRILDIGGTPDNWQFVSVQPRLVLLNMPRARADLAGAAQWVAGDGRWLPFGGQSFDVVFSNSGIEHVGDAARQPAALRARGGAGGPRILGADAQPLVSRGAAPVDAIPSLAAETMAARDSAARHGVERGGAAGARPARVLYRTLFAGHPAVGPARAAGAVSGGAHPARAVSGSD